MAHISRSRLIKAKSHSLFTYNAFNVISDGLEAKAGTVSADLSRYMAWKTTNGQTKAKNTQAQLEVLIHGLLNPVTLLDMIRHFIVFESNKQEDANGLITIKTIKKDGCISSVLCSECSSPLYHSCICNELRTRNQQKSQCNTKAEVSSNLCNNKQ